MSNQIPGVPEGWELVRIDNPTQGEWFIDGVGLLKEYLYKTPCGGKFPIISKIEEPARYRPFESAEEFKPHRDRWVRRVLDELVFRCTSYGGGALVVYGDLLPTFSEAFAEFVFDDDGTPFGVRIDE
jgi:hypothetical protein